MPEFVLNAKTAFNLDKPVAEEWKGLRLREIEGGQVWRLSVPRDRGEAFGAAVGEVLGFGLPDEGRFGVSGDGARLYFAGERQWFLTGGFASLPAQLAASCFATDQTDGWIGLEMEGAASREVLIRLVGIDVHRASFPAGSVARTPFEGMLAVLACEDDATPRYRVLFQRSSARSFLDHVRHAAASVCGPALSGAAH